MPSPSEASRPSVAAEDSFLDLLVETIESLDRGVRGQFLQKFFKAVAQVELEDTVSLEFWDQILTRRKALSESLDRPVSLKTAIVDVLSSTNLMRMPILMEYDELKKLQINAATDALTGLYNRRLFEDYFNKELNRVRRYGQHLALVMIDLHKFKEVNDRYGHLQGDQALQAAAATLRKTLRTSDYAFRIGGDEFALLLPQTDPEQSSTLARRLRANYDASIQPMKFEVPLALDYGVAVCPEDGDQQEALIRVADERLYALKNSMRGHTSRVVTMEREPAAATPARETRAASMPVAAGSPVAAAAASVAAAREAAGADKRKWERVSLVGTRAYAVLGENTERTARVIDLSYGGVALQTDRPDDLPNTTFQAVLHVPILPPVKVSLRKAYIQQVDRAVRVGCAFVS
jgi:diguanylate cyclase (GGDEF)-like protein